MEGETSSIRTHLNYLIQIKSDFLCSSVGKQLERNKCGFESRLRRNFLSSILIVKRVGVGVGLSLYLC